MFVKGASVVRKIVPTVQAAAYASGNAIGTVQDVSNAVLDSSGGAILESVTVVSDGGGVDMKILIFDDTISTTITDKASPNISLADLKKCLGIISIASADFVTAGGTPAVATKTGVGITLQPATGVPNNTSRRNLKMVILAAGSVTFGSTSGCQVSLGLLQG